MADSVVTLGADLSVLRRELAKLPNLTSENAQKMLIALEKQVNKAEKVAKAAAKNVAKANTQSLTEMGNSAKYAGVAIAGTAAAVVGLIQKVADSTNELVDMSTRTGIAAETLAGLRVAAKGSGLDLEQLQGALASFPKRMADFARGTGEGKAAFEALGISVTDASGHLRSADSVFNETMTALGGVKSQTERAALATQLFGEAGSKLLQSLGDPRSIAAFTEFASKFGTDLGPHAAKAATDWQRSVANLDVAMQELSASAVRGFAGKTGAAGALDIFNQSLVFFSALMEGSLREAGAGIKALIDLFSSLGTAVKASIALLSGDLKGWAALTGSAVTQVGDSLEVLASGPKRAAKVVSDAVAKTEEWTAATTKLADALAGSARGGADVESMAKAVKLELDGVSKAALQAARDLYEATERARELAAAFVALGANGATLYAGFYDAAPAAAAFNASMADGPGLIERLSAKLQGLRERINDAGGMARVAAGGLADMGKAAAAGMANLAMGLASGGLGMLMDLAKSAGEGEGGGKQLANQAVDAAISFVDTLAAQLPKALRTLIKRIPDLTNALAESLPKLGIALAKQVPRLATALVEALPEVIGAVVAALPEIIGGLIAGLPKLLWSLVKLVPTLIAEVVTQLWERVGEGISHFVSQMWEKIKGLFDFGELFKGNDGESASTTFGGSGQKSGPRGAYHAYADTPGPVRAGMSGLRARFAAGDTVIAARTAADLQRQADSLGRPDRGPAVAEFNLRDGHVVFERAFRRNVAAGGTLAQLAAGGTGQRRIF